MDEQPVPQSVPSDDISQKTLVALVVLSCVVSLLGIAALLYQASSVPAPLIQNNNQAKAEASFVIGAPQKPAQPQSTGFATFAIGDT